MKIHRSWREVRPRLRLAEMLITTCEKPVVLNSAYLWRLSYIPLREHLEADCAILDFLSNLFDRHLDPQQILEPAPSNAVDFVFDKLLIPTVFAHARLHDLVENVTPH